MLILPDAFRYRLLSETRAAVCLILGPVFVLWFKASFAKGKASLDFGADHSWSAGDSVLACGVVTSTTFEGDESPEAFHA